MQHVLLLIFIILLVLVVLLLFIPVNVIINYSETLSIHLTVFGIKFKLPTPSKKDKKINKIGNSSSASNKEIKKLKGKFSFNMDIFKLGKESLTRILKGLKIKDFTIKVKASGQDAASTAIAYGKLSAIIYPFCGIIVSKISPKNYDISVCPDFLGDKTNIYFNFHFSGKIFEVLKSLLYFIIDYNKIKKV